MISRHDLSNALASLGLARTYTFSFVLSLALALGVLTAMFNLNHQLLAKPLPYPASQHLYLLKGDSLRDGKVDLKGVVPYSAILELYRNDKDHFSSKGLVHFCFDVIRSIPDQGNVFTSYITPEYLALLQPPMALGRIFSDDEGLGAKAPVAVLSFNAWQEFFQGDPKVLGKTLRFGEVNFKIIGVTAADFVEPQLQREHRSTQVWLPWDFGPMQPNESDAWGWFLADQYFIGKLKSDLQPQQVALQLSAHLNALFHQHTRDIAFFAQRGLNFELVSYRKAILGESKDRTLLLLAGAIVLLLTALVSISHLLLVRALSQQQAMAIKGALGARPMHLLAGILAELLTLLVATWLLAVAVAYTVVVLFKVAARDQLPRLAELHLSWESLVFAAVSTLLLMVGFSWLLSRQINYRALHGLLQRGGKGVGLQISSSSRRALILIQVILIAILLAASMHTLKQSWDKLVQPTGFIMDNIYQVPLSIGSLKEQPIAERKIKLRTIRDTLLLHPKVLNASLAASYFPTNADYIAQSFVSVDPQLRIQKHAIITPIDSRFLQILGLPLIAGRYFSEQEFSDSPARVIVNQTLAEELRADGQVVGQKFFWPDEMATSFEIIGVVGDFSLPNLPEESRIFIPYIEPQYPGLLLSLKSGEHFTIEELNLLLGGGDGELKAADIISIQHAYDVLVAPQKLSIAMAIILAALSLLLGSVGVYSVLAYGLQLRRFELGIRMAIGARSTTLVMQLLKSNLAPVSAGLVCALPLLCCVAYWLDRVHFSVIHILSVWLMVSFLIYALAITASLISIIPLLRKPASYALRGH